jgi:hypothetical protein
MKNTMQSQLRLMFVVRPPELEVLPSVIKEWARAFETVGGRAPEPCVWVTGRNVQKIGLADVCLHTLELAPSIDFYARSPMERKPWSPWGLKSGPNFQFFEILRRMSRIHKTDWVLQLESDTLPLREVTEHDLMWMTGDAWVVGAAADYGTAPMGASSTAGHINGAAFYRVGSPEFISFLEHTWARSLLHVVSRRPALAYDSITSPELWRELPEELARDWRERQTRFLINQGMMNLSNKVTRLSDPLAQLEAFSPQRDTGHEPWWIHIAKVKS